MININDDYKQSILLACDNLDEKQLRLFLGATAKSLGHGGIKLISQISGVSVPTIRRGIRELEAGYAPDDERIRRKGAGRRPVTECYPGIMEAIQKIIEPHTYGSPEKAVSYTTMSLRRMENILLADYGIKVSHTKISSILDAMGYSRQANKKCLQTGTPHPDRNAQFGFINSTAEGFLQKGEPAISVDTKKKENIGNFKNSGTEYRQKKSPRPVLDHDFPLKELGKVAPYGIYVLNNNTGFINLGTSHDTAEFAGASVLGWWECVGKHTFPDATRLYITCDCGGSNGNRLHMWKYELSKIADITGLEIHVSHYPSGTSKWNKIEHRLFCYISKNWQGQPLVDIETVVSLIGSTTTTKGLSVICRVDENHYDLGVKVSDAIFNTLNIEYLNMGQWNYIIRPSKNEK